MRLKVRGKKKNFFFLEAPVSKTPSLFRLRVRSRPRTRSRLRAVNRMRAASRRHARFLVHAAGVATGSVLDLVLPPACRLCREPVDEGAIDFCQSCDRALRLSETTMRHACRRCGMPQALVRLQWGETKPEESNRVAGARESEAACPHCRERELAWDQVFTLWAYQGLVRDAIVAAKYPQQAALGHALGLRLAALVRRRLGPDLPDLITFVPCHLTRRLARGGVGTAVIAAAVARELRRPCRQLAKTTRPIAKQAWLDDSQRLHNVRGAFVAKRSYAFPRTPGPQNRHILLVDDVLTTGATANEVAKVLRGNGGQRVSLAVVARAIRS